MIERKENIYNDNDDLKFIPLNIKKQFIEKNSTWVPLLDNNLQVENLNENFLINFENNINNLSLERRNIQTLEYVEGKKALPYIKKQKFEEDFNLEYPSETYEEELYSYNKEECKKTTNTKNNTLNKNNTLSNTNLNYYNNVNESLDNNNSNYKNNNNNYKNNTNSNNDNQQNYNNNYKNNYNNEENKHEEQLLELDYYKELIHMSLLRDMDFNTNINENFRENKNINEKIDKIFKMVKSEESILETFKVYNVPRPLSDLIIKKIIKITLENNECK